MSDKTEIKSCPACGGEASSNSMVCMLDITYMVTCNCEMGGPIRSTEDEAIEAWNNQPRISELEAKVKFMGSELKRIKKCLEHTKILGGHIRICNNLCDSLDYLVDEPTAEVKK